MSQKWRTVALGDVCVITGGGTPSKRNPAFYGGPIPWATVRDLGLDTLTTTEHSITQEAVESSSTNVIDAGTVVIASRVGLGKVSILGQDTAINQDLRAIIPISPNVLLPGYLFWWFKSIEDFIVGAGTGATVQGVKLPFLRALRLPLPPLAEQERIVRILDEALDAINTAQTNIHTNINEAGALFAAELARVMNVFANGTRRSLGDLCKTSAGGTPLKSDKSNYENGDIPWILSGEVNSLEIWQPANFITRRGLENSSAKIFPESTVLVAMYGATAGKVSILRTPACTNQAVCGILPNPSFLPDFLAWYLRSIETQIVAQAQGNAQPNLSQAKIRDVLLPVISLQEQRNAIATIEAMYSATQALATNQRRLVDRYDKLRSAFLREAFEGGI